MMAAFPLQTPILSFWLLYATMFKPCISTLSVHCNDEDKQILLNFKQGVIDPSDFLATWSTKRDCCLWAGVQCDNITGRVTKLNLPCSLDPISYEDKSKCLTGSLDIALLKIEFLSYVDLSHNNFKVMHMPSIQYGFVDSWQCYNSSVLTSPHLCGNSSSLLYLDLSYNYDLHIQNLDWLSHASSLKYLNLSGIDLYKQTNWLESINLLPSVLELQLSSCHLYDINPSLGFVNFTSVQDLDLSYNAFHSKLPSWSFNLSDISYFDLCGNHLIGEIPKALLGLRNLKTLGLCDNMLNGSIPEWLGQYEHIRTLNLRINLFSGPIPSTLGNLSSLIHLFLTNNPLNGSLPESLGQLSNLEVLHVGGNPLAGVLTEKNFVKLSNLKILFLAFSAFIFDFDPRWVPPFQLDAISLGYLDLKIPKWLYTQRSLRMLFLSNSRMRFEKEDKFWNFVAEIEYLFLRRNSITGDMSNLVLNSRLVGIDSNNLRGGLPRLSPNVTFFKASNNSFSGSISALLYHKMNEKSHLLFLDLSRNHLSGGLTNCWMNWKSLVHVNLGENNLTGKIPPSMGLLSNITSLHLHMNNLSGHIPLSLKNCQELWILNLGENNFSGNIPNWLGQSTKILQLRSNQFRGHIPPQICQLSSLRILNLAENRISGPIPSCLQNIKAMVFNGDPGVELDFVFEDVVADTPYGFFNTLELFNKGQEAEYDKNLGLLRFVDLSNNALSGTIPAQLFTLTGLQSLNLSHNQLMGRIPEEIGNMKQLETLDLSRNKLSGEIPQSMSALSFLGFLNLSFNNFMGKIPSGTQLQSFSSLSYVGNPGLCGAPLKICAWELEKPDSTKPTIEDQDEGKDEILSSWFYFGLGVGFAAGFWGLLAPLFFSKTWRFAYFKFLDDLMDRCNVMEVLKTKCIYRWLKREQSEASRRVV